MSLVWNGVALADYADDWALRGGDTWKPFPPRLTGTMASASDRLELYDAIVDGARSNRAAGLATHVVTEGGATRVTAMQTRGMNQLNRYRPSMPDVVAIDFCCYRWSDAVLIDCEDLTEDDVTLIDTPNGDMEDGLSTQWSWFASPSYLSTSGSDSHSGSNAFNQIGSGGFHTVTYTWADQTFLAGRRYAGFVWLRGSNNHTISLGVAGGDQATTDMFGLGSVYTQYHVCWTPTANRTGVSLRVERWQTGQTVLDDVSCGYT